MEKRQSICVEHLLRVWQIFALCVWAGPVLGLAQTGVPDPLADWRWRNPLPTPASLYSVAFGANAFVAVGEAGTIVRSLDGIAWTVIPSGTAAGLNRISFATGHFVVIGAEGTLLTSEDGSRWTKQTIETVEPLVGITHGNGRFVVSTRSGTLLLSPDGINWDVKTNAFPMAEIFSSFQANYYHLGFGNGRFVAAVASERGSILYSSLDGVAWTPRYTNSMTGISGLVFGNGRFVASANGGQRILSSTDGENWTTQTGVDRFYSTGVGYGNGVFFIGGQCRPILTSTDGVSWTERKGENFQCLNGFAYGNGVFVAVSSVCCGPVRVMTTLLSSSDGVTWTPRTVGSAYLLRSIAYGNGIFIAAGFSDGAEPSNSNSLMLSTNGVNWSNQPLGPNQGAYGVAFGNGRFVVFAQPSIYEPTSRPDLIYTSSDGKIWTKANSTGAPHIIQTIVYGNGLFVAFGSGGSILTSENGLDWTERSSGTPHQLWSMAYGNGQFVATAKFAGVVLTSPDGLIWAAQKPFSYFELGPDQMVFGNGVFVAANGRQLVNTRQAMFISTDGRSWEPVAPGLGTNGGVLLAYGANTFVALIGQQIWSSLDGRTWILRNSGLNLSYSGSGTRIWSLTFGNNSFVAVGDYGGIFQSGEITTSVVPLKFQNSLIPLVNGGWRLGLTAQPNAMIRIETSENLKNWLSLTNLTSTNSNFDFVDPTVQRQRFYRATQIK
jgi:hypothetical protein